MVEIRLTRQNTQHNKEDKNMRNKKHQTVIATEENVFSFVKRVCMMADAFKQMGGKMNFDSAMDKLNYQFGDSLGEELMVKASKALEEHGIIR